MARPDPTRRAFLAGSLAAAASSALADPQTANTDPIRPFGAPTADLALVLAVDCSRSIDGQEYRLQAEGYAAAFRHARARRAILGGPTRRIAVAMTQWGGQFAQTQTLGWTLLDTEPAIDAFAARLEGQPRLVSDDATAIGAAIDHAVRVLAECPFAAARRTIDVSGDGRNNQGRFPRFARDDAVAAGVGINGLPILTDETNLAAVYRSEVIGGPGAFVVPARNSASFADAIVHKLAAEIA
ncbi:MAG: DUF1194 domain-containing protein [Magnetospirillum sp.]|nr:DUF1194 domain-containing protein [Magnetospirillum sp.]